MLKPLLLIAVVSLIGCSAPLQTKTLNAWPPEVRQAILSECVDFSKCSCRLDAAQRLFTAAEFETFRPKLLDGTAGNDPKWQQVLQACP